MRSASHEPQRPGPPATMQRHADPGAARPSAWACAYTCVCATVQSNAHAHAEQRCLLVALAQIAHGLTRA